MRSSFHLSCLLLVIGFLLTASAVAHPQTRQRFLGQQQQRRGQVQTAALESEPVCALTIDLAMEGRRKSIAGNVRITPAGAEKPLDLGELVQRELGWFAMPVKATIHVPRTRLTVEVLNGMESTIEVREIDLSRKSVARMRFTLKPFYSTRERGLQGGNTHLHLMKLTHAEMDHYLRTVPAADDLDLLFVSVLRRIPDERDYITNTFQPRDVERYARDGVQLGFGEEHRHNFGRGGEGFGHVMLLDIPELVRPISIGPGIMRSGTDGRPLRQGILKTHGEGGTVIWCHNTFGHEDLPNWAEGLIHAQNIFDGGSHGAYDDSFYRYLDVGMRVPFSTGTDWFIYDFNRVYLPVSGPLTQKKWLAQLQAGRSYITNGPLLEFEANDHQLGDTIKLDAAGEITLTGRAVGRENFSFLELVQNGTVIERVAAQQQDGHYEASLKLTVTVDQAGWFALRTDQAAGNNAFGKPLFSHTSPIYVEYGGRLRFLSDVAEKMITEMTASMDYISQMATFADEAERESVMKVYREAIEVMKERITSNR